MKRSSKIAGLGLLWLSAVLAAPITATLVATDHPLDIEGGGGFLANTGGASFEMYCVDYRNDIGFDTPYSVNITDLGTDPLGDTRYGDTDADTFSFAVSNISSNVTVGTTSYSVESAFNRYLLAAYLISQYNQTSVTEDDVAIQNTIWNLLDVNGVDNAAGTSASSASELSLAIAWEAGQTAGQLQTFANTVDIIDSIDLGSQTNADCGSSSSNQRYCSGMQEMITFDPPAVPEPNTLILIGSGMILLAGLRHRSGR